MMITEKPEVTLVSKWLANTLLDSPEPYGYIIVKYINECNCINKLSELEDLLQDTKKVAARFMTDHIGDPILEASYKYFSAALDNYLVYLGSR